MGAGRWGAWSAGEELQRVYVARTHRAEVASVERCEFRFAQTLDDGEDCRIDEADAEVGVCGHELGHPVVVGAEERLHLECAGVDVVQYLTHWGRAEASREEVVELYEHRGGNEPRLDRVFEERRADVVAFV